MSLRLYMDQDSLDFDVIAGLRMANIDVLSSQDARMQRATDEQQLTFATVQGRVLYTANRRDFARLHAEWLASGRHHAGIVLRARQQVGVRWQIKALVAPSNLLTAERWIDRLEYL